MAGRALFAFLALLVVVALTEESGVIASVRALGRDGLVVTVFLGLSSGTFLLALNYTSVANVLFLQASAPVMAALLGWAILSERISRRTWIAMVHGGGRRRGDGHRLVPRRRAGRGRCRS